MSDDLPIRLRRLLEGKPANSPEANLLREAVVAIQRLRFALSQAAKEIERLGGKPPKRKPPDDDGLAEVAPTGPPKRPRGGAPASANRIDNSGELARAVQSVVPAVSETEKASTAPAQ